MCTRKQFPRRIFLLFAAFIPALAINAQQEVIANKMNTRTDVTRPFSNAVGMNYFTAARLNGVNEIQYGQGQLPVRVYPTIIAGNTVNAIASFPVERIVVTNGSGQQVYVQEVGGKSQYINISIPSLSKGMYWMTFTGQGWNSTGKFIIP